MLFRIRNVLKMFVSRLPANPPEIIKVRLLPFRLVFAVKVCGEMCVFLSPTTGGFKQEAPVWCLSRR